MRAWRARLEAVLRQRCPRCLRGEVFAGPVRMRERCPVCGLVFEREEGYFFGAMYVSYFLSVPAFCLLALLAYELLPGRHFAWVLCAAAAGLLLLVPTIFRYSRVIWMHIDRAIDPEE